MNQPGFGRRHLLKLGLAIGGAGVVASTGLGWAVFHLRPTAAGNAVLSTEEMAFLEAVAEALFPPENALAVDVKKLNIAQKVDQHLAHLYPREQRGARAVLSAIDWWPRLSFQSTKRFAAMPLAERVAVLGAWDESPHEERRAVPSLLRLMVGLHVFAAEETLAAMGHRFGCTPDPATPPAPAPNLPPTGDSVITAPDSGVPS